MSEATAAFEVRRLVRTFPGQVEALRGVDLTVESGQTVVITGPSGCGKSTLLHLLAAIDVPTSGSIAAAGQDLSQWGDLGDYRRRYVGLVFQFHDLIPRLPVSANVELPMFGTGRPPRKRRQRAQELLELVDMGFAAHRLPNEISGGERQRVAIARALANDPAVLLADEPTGSLDSASTERIIDLFGTLRDAGRTIVIVTHAAEVAAVADVVVHMQDGVVTEAGRQRQPGVALDGASGSKRGPSPDRHAVSIRAVSPRAEAPLGRPDAEAHRDDRAFCFDAVRHCYGDHVALDGLSLEVGRGEMVALLGPNGAGKSTTMSLLLGLARPQEGTVEVLGSSPWDAVAQGRVGAMLQTGPGSGLPTGVRVEAALRLVGRLYRRPAPFEATVERAGIGGLLSRKTHQLSGGQAQRVRFALAIAGDPELVLLDEPTAAMDVESRRSFWRMIRQFGAEGRTVVFATHHLQEADQIASRVTVINHGRVVADGAGASLKAAVCSRRVHFISPGPDEALLDTLEGVTDVSVAGTSVVLSSLDTDATISALVRSRIEFHHLEVGGGGLEEAFVLLTEPGDRPEAGP